MKNNSKIAALALATVIMGQSVQPIMALEKEYNNNMKSVIARALASEKNTENVESTSTVDLRLMATTDLHSNLMNHDYYTDKQDDSIGMAKIATLIEKAREEVNLDKSDKTIDNAILVDNGDIIQGTPLSSVFASNEATKTKPGEKYPIYEALDLLGYDATTLGNHEFNYGLDFLKQITDKSVMDTDVVNANVYDMNGNPLFNQYKVIEETVIDSNGQKQTIKIGLTGFVPPQILNWDKKNLEGKVTVEDIKTAADKVTKTLKEKEGVDIVIALAHTGTGTSDEHIKNAENAAYQLTKVEGMDVVVAGHSHSTGTTVMNGVQVIQPSNWGKELGIVDLKLEQVDGKWVVNDEKTTMEKRNVKELKPENSTLITGSSSLMAAHKQTIDFVNGNVGSTKGDLNSFFSLVADNSSVELVTKAQKWYAQNKIAEGQDELKAYKDLPILSTSAPYKAGGRQFNEATSYVDIKAGGLKIKDLSNLYLYDNTISIVKVNGAQVKEWLEMSATMFNTIDVNSTETQQLLNEKYRSYNFDTIEGVTYEIDVTKDAKYDLEGNVVNANTERIVNLQYNGKPIDLEQEFLVVTNNYRASLDYFAGVKDGEVVFSSADENRQALMDYIQSQGEINPTVDNNWKIKSVDTDAKIVFNSSLEGKSYSEDLENVSFVSESTDEGMAVYSYDLRAGLNNDVEEDDSEKDEIVEDNNDTDTGKDEIVEEDKNETESDKDETVEEDKNETESDKNETVEEDKNETESDKDETVEDTNSPQTGQASIAGYTATGVLAFVGLVLSRFRKRK